MVFVRQNGKTVNLNDLTFTYEYKPDVIELALFFSASPSFFSVVCR